MLSEEQSAFTSSLKQAILRLCHDGVPHVGKIEVDGIICIHIEDDQQSLIVKLHETLFKPAPGGSTGNAYGAILPATPSHWPPPYPGHRPASQLSNNLNLELRDLLSQSRHSRSVTVSPDVNNDQMANNLSDGEDVEETEHTQKIQSNGLVSNEIVQAPLYRQLWDKYKSSGSGGSAKRGMKLPHIEPKSAWGSAMSLPCKICRASVGTAERLEKHYGTVHKLLMCKQCLRTFSMYSNLKRHMRLHTGQRPYRCTICGKTFTRKDDLTNHILKHKDAKPFTCGLCKKGYTERSSIRGHLRRDHNASTEDIHICTQCGVAYASLTAFVSHLKTHSKSSSSSHFAFVQEYSSVVDSEEPGCQPELSCHSFNCEVSTNDSSSQKLSKQAVTERFSNTPERSDSETPHQNSKDVTSKDGTSKSRMDVLVSRPDGTPHTVSIKLGNLSETTDTRTANNGSSSPRSNESRDRNVVTDSADRYSCIHCTMSFSSFAEINHHMVKLHGKHSCVHCKKATFDTTQDLNNHLFYCQHKDVDAMETSRACNEAAMHSAVPEPVESEVTTVKVKVEVCDDDNGEDDDDDDDDAVGSRSSHHKSLIPSFTSLSQPVFPGSPLHYQTDRNFPFAAGSTNSRDFALSKSSDSHSFGRIIEIKDVQANGSTLKKQRTSSAKQVCRDQQGELICPFRYDCSICKEVFTDTEDFLNHCTNAHQRYGCKYCGQMFTQCGNRNRHLRYHSGDRPFVCQECGDTFARQDALKNHVDARHKKTMCPVCGIVFAKPQLAAQHLRSEHGVLDS